MMSDEPMSDEERARADARALDTMAIAKEVGVMVAVAFIGAGAIEQVDGAISMCEAAVRVSERERPDIAHRLYPAQVAAQSIREATASIEQSLGEERGERDA